MKKVKSLQSGFYKRLTRVLTGTPDIAITMELGISPISPMEYKIQKKQLMEYQSLLKMNEEKLSMKVAIQTKEIGSRNISWNDTIWRKYC